MKKIFKQSFILLALLGVMFTSCKKDYPEPNITVLPVGTVYTIDSILKMEAGTVFNDDASVYGIVTADEKSGNLYKAAFIQDPETNAAIELYLNAKSGVTTGDYIRVYLKGVTYSVYNNLPQLSGFEADGHIVILANDDKRIKPMTTTIANLKANQDKYIGRLVRLENVWFTEQGTFAELNGYGERCLVDASSPTGDNNFIVRTSNYANFAQDPLPSDTGNLVAIASLYKSTWQLLVRSKSDLEFHNFSGGGGVTPEPPAPAGEVQKLPYVQSFETSFGSYTTYDVSGAQKWIIDFKTAKMTGYEGGTNNANEDWLISSPVDLTGITDAKMTMSYICRYFSNLSSDITVWASTDYTFGNDPTTATWTQMSASLSESSDWNTFKTAEIALTSMVGQTMYFAVKYVSTEQKAGTIEVQSIAIEEGTASGGGGGVTPPNPGNLTGDGSRENPYTASDVIAMGVETSDGNKYWVKDYIVGAINTTGYAYEFTASVSAASNMIISSNVNASTEEECVPVQLPAGAVRTGVNLVDNPGNYQQEVLLYGTLEKYFQKPSVKNVTYAEIGGNSYGTDPGATPVVPTGEVQTMPYTQSFATEFGTYVTKNVTGAEAWEIAYSSAKMTGFNVSAKENEDWLISSPVQITGVEHAKAVLEYASKYDAPSEKDITIQVSSNYEFNAEPSTATWTELSASFTNNNKDWNFDELVVNLDEFIGQTVNVAVKYTSTTAGARTIEIKTITIEEETGDTPTPPDPPTPPTPGNGEGSGTADDPYNVAAGISLQGQNATGWVRGYIVGAVKSGPQSVSSNDDIEWAAPFSRATNVLISDDPDCHEVTNCIIVELTKDKPLRTEVNLVDHPENFGKTLSVTGTLRNYFGQAGLRGSAGTSDDFVLADPAK